MLTVLMATYNGAASLPAVLSAYRKLIAPEGGWSLLVVDDGSSDATPQILESFQVRSIRVARGGKNAALNVAIACCLAEAVPELFVFTDDDAVPDANWLCALQHCARTHADYDVFGGRICPQWPHGASLRFAKMAPQGMSFGLTEAQDGPIYPGLVWGANMAVRGAVLAGGERFHAGLGPRAGAYTMGGETDFTRRLADQGHASWFCAQASVRHLIKAEQLGARSLLARAFRFGRGMRRQEKAEHAPAWMFAKLAQQACSLLGNVLRADLEGQFANAWECCYLLGYITRPQAKTMVLVTGCSGQLGGMELRMQQECRALQGMGQRSCLALPHFAGVEKLHARHFDPPRFFEQWEWRRLNLWRARWITRYQLRHMQASLVHVAFCWTAYGASSVCLAHFARLPVVISVHGAFPVAQFSPWHCTLLQAAFAGVRGIYAVSATALELFLASYRPFIRPTAKLAVIPNCVDTSVFLPGLARRNKARQRLGIDEDALVMGCVARLSSEKQPGKVLDIFLRLRSRFRKLQLVLIGSGPLEAELRAKAPYASVHFLGHRDDVAELMPALDLHILLSRAEGFGISTIEAMACGVAVAGAHVPGIADVLEGSAAGMLVPPGDDAMACELVSQLLADPLRRCYMGQRGREEAVSKYATAELHTRLRHFYAGLLP